MNTTIDGEVIRAFLMVLGEQYPDPARLTLLGGSALCLLGSPRPTLDIDYVGDDLKKDALQQCMQDIAAQMHLDVEAVPIDQFMPLPDGTQERNLPAGRFGKIEVIILDPYVIAMSKIERGFDTDMEDVIFLVRSGLVHIETLEPMIDTVLEQALKFDIDPIAVRNHWQDLRNQLG